MKRRGRLILTVSSGAMVTLSGVMDGLEREEKFVPGAMVTLSGVMDGLEREEKLVPG